MTHRIFRPDTGLHPWVDPVGDREMHRIGQQQQGLCGHRNSPPGFSYHPGIESQQKVHILDNYSQEFDI
jgi:hypothetical protein